MIILHPVHIVYYYMNTIKTGYKTFLLFLEYSE